MNKLFKTTLIIISLALITSCSLDLSSSASLQSNDQATSELSLSNSEPFSSEQPSSEPSSEISSEVSSSEEINIDLDELLADITVSFTHNDNDFEYVTANLNLVHSVDPHNLVTVSWVSSAPTLINEAGIVNLPESDTTVTLTLTLAYAEETRERDFLFVVKRRDNFYIYIDEEPIFNGVPNTHKLTAKTLYGHDFLYYTDVNGAKYYPNDIVTGPLSLTSNFRESTYTVSFYIRNVLYKTFTVTHDDTIEQFADPLIAHGDFLGWYVWAEAFDFTTPIQSDLRVDALVSLYEYTVNFYVNDELYETQIVEAYTTLPYLDLYEDGYDFDGWYMDSGLTQQYYFHLNTVLSDLDLYATREMVTVRAVHDYRYEGTYKFIAYVSDFYGKYTYLSDADGYSKVVENAVRPSGLSAGDKVVVSAKMIMRGGQMEIESATIIKIIAKAEFSLPNIVYDYSLTSFDNDHFARKFDFFELNVNEVDSKYFYTDVINNTTYPSTLKIKIDHSYLNKPASFFKHLEHRRISVQNIYLHDSKYLSGYHLTFNMYSLDDFTKLPLNDKEKEDETYNYLVSIMPDTISEGNLTLPTEHVGTSIVWSSNKPDIISEDGVVHYENMSGFQEEVILHPIITSGDRVYPYLDFTITVIDSSRLIENTSTFGNVGLETSYANIDYVDANGVVFHFSHMKKSGTSAIMSTNTYSDFYIQFPSGLISFSFKYRVKSSRPHYLYINVNQTDPYVNHKAETITLSSFTTNVTYEYTYDTSHLNSAQEILMWLNTHSSGFELEILSVSYVAQKAVD